jgi:hypothetical protein
MGRSKTVARLPDGLHGRLTTDGEIDSSRAGRRTAAASCFVRPTARGAVARRQAAAADAGDARRVPGHERLRDGRRLVMPRRSSTSTSAARPDGKPRDPLWQRQGRVHPARARRSHAHSSRTGREVRPVGPPLGDRAGRAAHRLTDEPGACRRRAPRRMDARRSQRRQIAGRSGPSRLGGRRTC